MFSRLFAVFAVLASVAALPATDRTVPTPITTIYNEDFERPWESFAMFKNLFEPLWRLLPSFADIGPNIVTDDNKFEVNINVKDYKKKDLKVKVNGNLIMIQGLHEAKQDDHDIFASQFFHTYGLPAQASGDDVTAKLTSDNFLIVRAPVSSGSVNKTQDVDREVPIEETGKPLSEEEKTEKPVVTTESPVTGTTEDDRKEPTTASNKEEVTEKDNVIPHGNEIQL